MEITYRTKQKYGKGFFGTGIQIKYSSEEKAIIEKIKTALEPFNYKFSPSPFPDDWKPGQTCSFHANGSQIFGLQTKAEHDKFLKESFPILKSFDSNMTKEIFIYNND